MFQIKGISERGLPNLAPYSCAIHAALFPLHHVTVEPDSHFFVSAIRSKISKCLVTDWWKNTSFNMFCNRVLFIYLCITYLIYTIKFKVSYLFLVKTIILMPCVSFSPGTFIYVAVYWCLKRKYNSLNAKHRFILWMFKAPS